MDASLLTQFKDLGLISPLALGAMGSALGAGEAGMATIGAWKKSFAQNKMAAFIMLAFVGAPLTQTIYGMITMNAMIELAQKGQYLWGLGILCGIANGLSAWFQGKAGASAADAMGETGKGFGNYLMVLGIIETVAIFVMVFSLMAMGKLKAGL
ncbi:MAG: V-type ATP synthase subunit K [Candidatus Omnitrophota bacterium]